MASWRIDPADQRDVADPEVVHAPVTRGDRT
jgi:hypothetical protein